MTFLQPLFFWAATLILPLAAIYFLKVRPRRETTTAIFLWQKIYQQKQTSSLLSRLRDILSLLLMILVFLLLTFAMTRPQFAAQDRKDLLILIDNSVSMASENDSQTRLEQGRKEAKKIVAGMTAGKRAAVACLANQIEYKSYLTDNSKQLIRAIDSIDQTNLPFNRSALEKAAVMSGSQETSRIILISDAAAFSDEAKKDSLWFDKENAHDPNSSKNKNRRVELIKISPPAQNVGIISCDLQEVVTQNGRMSFYFQLANSGEKPIETSLLLYHIEGDIADQYRQVEEGDLDQLAGRLVKVIPVTISPGVNEPLIFNLAEYLSGKYIAVLDHKDAMAKDNLAYLYVHQPAPIKIGVLNPDRFFFERCIEAFSQTTGLVELTEVSFESDNSPQVLLANGQIPLDSQNAPDPNSKISCIIFNPAGESDCWTLTGNDLSPDQIVPKLIDKDNPAVRYYDPVLIPFYGAKELTLPVDSKVLLETDTGIALIWRVSRPDRDVFVINMDPSQGEFYYSPYFPVMIYRMALSLAGKEKIATSTYSTNDPFPEHIRKSQGMVTVTDPHGKTSPPIRPDSLGSFKTPGFYTVEQQGKKTDLACSILKSRETLVNGSTVDSNAASIPKGHSPRFWLTLLALAVIAGESILYHKRKVG